MERAVEALEAKSLPTEDAAHVVHHGADQRTLPRVGSGPLSIGHRSVLAACGWADPVVPGHHSFLPSDVDVEQVDALGLLGRGRGDMATDEPLADYWQTVGNTTGESVVVVNANEADARAKADDLLLGSTPLAVLDAAAAVADHVEATDLFVYCGESADWLQNRLGAAIEAAEERLGVTPRLVTGPETFRAGEETMALEAMEGSDRLEARRRPPGPAEHGLYGRPTAIHTPRTFAQIYQALTAPESFDGADADPGTRLVTVTGDVAAPATVELRTGSTLDTACDAVSRDGVSKRGAAIVGGQFGGVSRTLDVSASAPALRGAKFGTNGVVELLAESRCVVATVGERTQFAAAENCGRCVPCREGATQLLEKLRDVYDGEYDADGLRELSRVMRRSSICSFGVETARMVTTALDEFEPVFRAHARGRCPTGVCDTT